MPDDGQSDNQLLAVKAKPVALPHGDWSGTPRSDYVSLMQRVNDLQNQLGEARSNCQRADDDACVMLVDRLAELAKLWRESEDGEAMVGSGAIRAWFDGLWKDLGVEVVEATGQRIGQVSLEQFEVMETTPAERDGDDGLIAETWRPLIRRQGRTVRPGRIIVIKKSQERQKHDSGKGHRH